MAIQKKIYSKNTITDRVIQKKSKSENVNSKFSTSHAGEMRLIAAKTNKFKMVSTPAYFDVCNHQCNRKYRISADLEARIASHKRVTLDQKARNSELRFESFLGVRGLIPHTEFTRKA